MTQDPNPSGSALALAAASLDVGETFAERARIMGGRTAIRDDARSLGYAELEARANRLANALGAAGIGRGDRVAVLSENSLAYVELMLACAKIGAILACQNWRQAPEELDYCLSLVDPEMIFVSERYEATARGLGLEARVLRLGAETDAFAVPAPDRAPAAAVEPEDGLLILYTSGTTGRPKAAVISHRAMLARAAIMLSDGVLVPGRTFVAWSPMFHMAATDGLLGTLMTGGRVHIMPELHMPRLAELATEEAIGHLMLMPGMIEGFIEALKAVGRPAKDVGMVGVMADLVPRAQIAAITELLDAPYRNTFGATETGSAPASRGVIMPGEMPETFSKTQSSFCRLRLVDENDEDVPDGAPGEAAFRGPSLFSGYWNNPEANAEGFRGGWFHMGDVLLRNPDGTLDFVDRRKYLIKSGGENIYPAEIERVLLAAPEVAEAVVVRRPDPKWGEVPVAFVVPAAEGLTEEAVMALLDGRIARYKRPRRVVLIAGAEIERNATGKVMRAPLEARAKTLASAAPA